MLFGNVYYYYFTEVGSVTLVLPIFGLLPNNERRKPVDICCRKVSSIGRRWEGLVAGESVAIMSRVYPLLFRYTLK